MQTQPLILHHPSSRPSSLSSLIFDLDAPAMLANTPLDAKIGVRRQYICSLFELAVALGKPQASLLSDLSLMGLDFDSLSRAGELQLHLVHLSPGVIFAPHVHFTGHEIYFGLAGEGLMRIGAAMQNEKTISKPEQISPSAALSCSWSSERTAPLSPSSLFLVKSGEVHSLTNPSSQDLYAAFICGAWHLVEGGDRVFIPSDV